MIHKYSIVFMPDSEGLQRIIKMKNELAEKIKWYNSKNSQGHITICEFEIEEEKLSLIEKQMQQICTFFQTKEIHLDHFDSFENSGAFFIAPDSDSKIYLTELMKTINKEIKIKNKYSSTNPHLSIARKLDSEKLEMAQNLFRDISLHFTCKSIFIRKFNRDKRQFDVISEIDFLNQKPQTPIQQTLF